MLCHNISCLPPWFPSPPRTVNNLLIQQSDPTPLAAPTFGISLEVALSSRKTSRSSQDHVGRLILCYDNLDLWACFKYLIILKLLQFIIGQGCQSDLNYPLSSYHIMNLSIISLSNLCISKYQFPNQSFTNRKNYLFQEFKFIMRR